MGIAAQAVERVGEKRPRYDETASGQEVWSKFDPEGLDPASISASEYALVNAQWKVLQALKNTNSYGHDGIYEFIPHGGQLSGGIQGPISSEVDLDFDADPMAYAPLSLHRWGHDTLGNAEHAKTHAISEAVIEFRNGSPVTNELGYYLSMTSLKWGSASRWAAGNVSDLATVNAMRYPYIALGTGQLGPKGKKMHQGDWVLITNETNHKKVWAVYVDSRGGNNTGIEISPSAAKDLGITYRDFTDPATHLPHYIYPHGKRIRNPLWKPAGVTSQQTLSVTLFPGQASPLTLWSKSKGFIPLP